MKTVTVATKLTEKMAEMIDKMVEEGIYTSRSDALRDAARLLIQIKKGSFTGRARLFSKDEIIREYAREKGFKL